MKVLWEGRYTDGRTAKVHPVVVRPLKDGLRIALEDGTERLWPYAAIHQVQGSFSGEPVRLEFGENLAEAVVIPDVDFLHVLRAKSAESAGRFHDPLFRKTRAWLVLYAGLATLAVSFIFYKWGIPALASAAAHKVPIIWEKGLGDGELTLLAPEKTRIHNPRLDRDIRRIIDRLRSGVPGCDYPFRVVVSNAPIVNAMALPGGTILVFRGLLGETRSPEELAGVLAHEMQHVIKRHITKQIIQDSSLGIMISILSGDTTGSVAAGLQSARTFALLSYSRHDEAEADQEGMKVILATGIDPNGMIRFFDVLKAKGHEPEFVKYLSSHPATEDRIQNLKSVVRSVAAGKIPVKRRKITPLLPGEDWNGLVKGLPKGNYDFFEELMKDEGEKKKP